METPIFDLTQLCVNGVVTGVFFSFVCWSFGMLPRVFKNVVH
jgi:hypothetical protein